MLNFFKKGNQGIESLIEINGKELKIRKNIIDKINSFAACLGPPGAGKSTFCTSYYQSKYGVKKNYFEMSNEPVSFTKGLWILKEEERMKIKENINKDIIDVEGFQVDDIMSWKYVMTIAFLATDIILMNRDARFDSIKKVLKIVETSLKKMKEANIPKILKTICIHVTSKKLAKEENFKEALKKIDFNENSFSGIIIKPIYIPNISEDEKEENDIADDDITKYSKYKNNLLSSLDSLTPDNQINSASNLTKYIDSFNTAVNGKGGFDSQAIFEDLKSDFKGVYNRYLNKKKNDLSGMNLSEVKNENESFDDWINRQNIDFSFKIKHEDLTFYGSSDEFDNYYKKLESEETFKVNPRDIFKDTYDQSKRKLEAKNNQEKSDIEIEMRNVKTKINDYFSRIKFYGKIDINFNTDININNNQREFKRKCENDLIDYFNQKAKEKRQSWKDQIERAKYKAVVQAVGIMECEGGHKLNDDPVNCGGDCEGQLYWVDGEERYAICNKCGKITHMSGRLICHGCKKPCKCTVKWKEGYKP